LKESIPPGIAVNRDELAKIGRRVPQIPPRFDVAESIGHISCDRRAGDGVTASGRCVRSGRVDTTSGEERARIAAVTDAIAVGIVEFGAGPQLSDAR
jgi:hypothetical protein